MKSFQIEEEGACANARHLVLLLGFFVMLRAAAPAS